jgi:flagellar protein FliO/FliZ
MAFPFFRTFFRFFRSVALAGVLCATVVPALQAANGVSDADIRTFSEKTTEAPEKQTKPDIKPELEGWRLFFQAMGSLALVLGLIGVIAFVVKRYAKSAQLTSNRTDTIRIVSTKMLGGRRCLMLVRVRGQTLLLGVTPQSINCLTEIHEIEGEWVQPSNAEGAAVPGAFERQLGKFVNETIASEKPGSR